MEETSQSYIKVKVLGKGTFGEVSLVKNTKDQKFYALKEIRIHNAEEQKEALKEAQILSSLNHPNIIALKDYFFTKSGSTFNIVTEYVENGSLKEKLIKRKGVPLKKEEVLKIFAEVVDGVRYLHSKMILHRDIKSENILINKYGVAILADFGLSKALKSSMEKAKTQCGTLPYWSPELFQGKLYDYKSDIWALGVLLYELMELNYPFENPIKTMNAKYHPFKLTNYPQLQILCLLMLRMNPDHRLSIDRVKAYLLEMHANIILQREYDKDSRFKVKPIPHIRHYLYDEKYWQNPEYIQEHINLEQLEEEHELHWLNDLFK